MIGWLFAVFGTSLVGSLHCAGMCGGFVTCLAGDRCGGAPKLHGAYHVGRGLGYVTLGAIAGLLGAGVEQSALATGREGAAPIVFGALIIIFALATGARALGVRLPLPAPTAATRFVGTTLARLRTHGPWVRGGALGLLTAFLPCGWLYAFVATAAGTGSVLGGIATMTAFWLGTVPILLGLGLGTGRILRPLRERLPVVGAMLLLVLGLATLFGRGVPNPPPLHEPAMAEVTSGSPDAASLPQIPTEADCCGD